MLVDVAVMGGAQRDEVVVGVVASLGAALDVVDVRLPEASDLPAPGNTPAVPTENTTASRLPVGVRVGKPAGELLTPRRRTRT